MSKAKEDGKPVWIPGPLIPWVELAKAKYYKEKSAQEFAELQKLIDEFRVDSERVA